jgi:aldehyde:ferredoxin oxidoreductase
MSSETLGTGYHGKLLRVNLSTKEVSTEDLPKNLWEKFLGGRGLGAYFLTKEVAPDIVPLSTENKLIFMNGALSGTAIPGNNKICLTFKSPLTNSYSYSLCGGHFGPELKYAGYDGLIIEGKANSPVYLWINNDEIQIKDAQYIWGQLVPESEDRIRKELKGDAAIQIAVIGTAGEKLNKYACITSSYYREFGRGGGGTVMGSKNLKGIAIRGTKDVKYANFQLSLDLSEQLASNLRESPGGKIRRAYGTPELVEKINGNGFWITNNFQKGTFEDAAKLSGPQMRKNIVFGDSSCFACPIACGKRSSITLSNGQKMIMEGPEFETIGMLGSNCGISDWETLLKATKICDTNGFDTINAGACVSMVMEAYETEKLTLAQLDNLELKFGNKIALLQVLKLIAERKGIGDILAEGPKIASEKLGIPELAMHSKGQALAVYDPRGAKAMALTYATSQKGAHHMNATTMGFEINSGTRLKIKNKGLLQRNHQFSMCICDSIGICSTMRAGIPHLDQAKAFTAVTGIEVDETKLNLIAERIINMERMYNVQLGFSRKDDTLPKRFTEEPMPKGNGDGEGETVDLDALLDDFYIQMGWDKNGIPTKEKLKDLALLD